MDNSRDPQSAGELALLGIRNSHQHAEEVDEGWTERAIEKVAAYARREEHFLTESAKAWAYEDGLEVPPTDGAWGQVMRSAAARGIIHRFGRAAAKSPGSHGKLMALWRRGPGIADAPGITAEEAADKIRIIDELRVQMRKEGRSILAEAMIDCIRVFRELASDL